MDCSWLAPLNAAARRCYLSHAQSHPPHEVLPSYSSAFGGSWEWLPLAWSSSQHREVSSPTRASRQRRVPFSGLLTTTCIWHRPISASESGSACPPTIHRRYWDPTRSNALDQARVAKGVILSCAYLYGLASLGLSPTDVALWTRRENEFAAAEVAKYPARLVGFLSVDPLQASALEEIRHWRGNRTLVGLKLHLTASAVQLRQSRDVARVQAVLREAASLRIPIVIHLGGGAFDASDAETFIRLVLPSASPSWVQIAHGGGGLPLEADNHLRVLRSFADHITRGDSATTRVLFDLSYVPAPDESPEAVAAIVREMRRIGLNRFLFASDFNVLTPAEEVSGLARLGLSRRKRRPCVRPVPRGCVQASSGGGATPRLGVLG
jgi:predicted TIM-barrel fold metal-dependent hydrolase